MRRILPVFLTLMLIMTGCVGTSRNVKTPPGQTEIIFGSVNVDSENLRDAPSGNRIGSVSRGESYQIVMRRANWCMIDHDQYGEAWIWAPSLGLDRVHPTTVSSWLGTPRKAMVLDSLKAHFGSPTDVKPIGGEAVVYVYENGPYNGGTTFGTSSFLSAEATIDRASRTVVGVAITFPPFEGKANDILPVLGLQQTKASNVNFDRARYDHQFPGVDRVDIEFAEGNFERIGRAIAWRYYPDLWKSKVDVNERRVTVEDDQLVIEMWVTNRDAVHTFAAPSVEVELMLGSNLLGEWQLGPGSLRLPPGQKGVFRLPIPIKAGRIDVKQVAARAELTNMLVLPSGGGS